VALAVGIGIGAAAAVSANYLSPGRAPFSTGSEYQAIVLVNGQALFGRISGVSDDMLVVRDAYYVRNQVNPDSRELHTSLIRRATEIHGPKQTSISRTQVLFIEPVDPESQVAKLMAKDASSPIGR